MTSARTAGMYRRSAGMAAATSTASTISLDPPMRHHLVDKTVFLTGQVNFSERMVIILVSTAKFQTVFSGNSKKYSGKHSCCKYNCKQNFTQREYMVIMDLACFFIIGICVRWDSHLIIVLCIT